MPFGPFGPFGLSRPFRLSRPSMSPASHSGQTPALHSVAQASSAKLDAGLEIRSDFSWCRSEKCDAAVVILRLRHWCFNSNKDTFRLHEVFPGVTGNAAGIQLKIPKKIRAIYLLHAWPIPLNENLTPKSIFQKEHILAVRMTSLLIHGSCLNALRAMVKLFSRSKASNSQTKKLLLVGT